MFRGRSVVVVGPSAVGRAAAVANRQLLVHRTAAGGRSAGAKLERIDGKFISLTEFHGKAVLLCFWATWCPPCRRELPLLERLQTLVDRRSLEIVAVSIDWEGKPAVDTFLKSVNVTHLRPYLDP